MSKVTAFAIATATIIKLSCKKVGLLRVNVVAGFFTNLKQFRVARNALKAID